MKTKKILLFMIIVLFQINLYAQFAGGSGTLEDPYQVATLEQLQSIGNVENLEKHFIQISDIDALETVNWNDGEGFEPIGANWNDRFSGSYDGNGFLIEGLYINRPNRHFVGLFGIASEALLRNITLTEVEVVGNMGVGSLMGRMSYGLIENSFASGIVSGTSSVGGLVGENTGIIKNCSSHVNVSGERSIGGLTGGNSEGTIENSYASGLVSGTDQGIGGLVGTMGWCSNCYSLIKNSYATGEITGGFNVGGLVGVIYSSYHSVINSFATGTVLGTDSVGGLIGLSSAFISNSFSLGDVYGTGTAAGGLLGAGGGQVLNSYTISNVSGNDNVGGFVGIIQGWQPSISMSYSATSVSGITNVGSFIGRNFGNIQNSYYDSDISNCEEETGEGSSEGIYSLNTSQMTGIQAYDNMSGFDFGTIWKLTENYPALFWEGVEEIFPHVPFAPDLLSPTNESNNHDLNANFEWEMPLYTETFTLEISTDTNFIEIIDNPTNLTETEYISEVLDWGTTYYWRVLATNSVGDSEWSEVWFFSTIPAFNFSINSGETYCFEDQIEIGVEVNIEFEADNNFLIELSNKHGSFENPVILDQINTTNSFVTELSLPETLELGTPYSIRIKSTNPEAYSESLSFTVYQVPTSTFALDAEQLCGSESVTISYTGNATENATYDWDFDEGNIISGSGQGDYVVNWDTPETKTISLTVTENGCYSNNYSSSLPVYDPVSDFSMDNVVCENLNTIIEFIGSATDSATFNWDFNNANIVSGSGLGPYEVNWDELGTKNVSLAINDNGCLSTTTTKTIDHNHIPTATISAPERICYDGVANLNYTGSASSSASFNWDFDGGTVISGTSSGPYEVTWSNDGLKNIIMNIEDNGCSSDTLIQLIVNPQTQPNPICMVTVSESNKNMIVWEVPDNNPYESIVIYKESAQSDVYDVIGIQSVNEPSFFIDENSNPSQKSNRYRLAIIDTCGYETALSSYHKTMHLTINAGIVGSWNLIWDKYEGFEYLTFNIYRKAPGQGWMLIAEIPSNLFTFTDQAPPAANVNYQIEVLKSNPCGLTFEKLDDEFISSSRSNVVTTEQVSSSNELDLNRLLVWPNPVSDMLYINSESLNASNNLIISTVDGRVLIKRKIERGTTHIDMSAFPNGIYILQLNSGVNSFNKKIIKH